MSLNCPKCGGGTTVHGTVNFGFMLRRYRRCEVCGYRFKTDESHDTARQTQRREGYPKSRERKAPA